MAQSLEFTAKNARPFVDWLKRFVSIEKSVLLEIDGKELCFKAKSYDESKSVVKFSKISFEEAAISPQKKKDLPELIKVGIYSIQRLMKVLDNFSGTEFSLAVAYEPSPSGDLSGLAILIKSSFLKMKIECTPLNIFKYISDPLFSNKIANDSVVASFEMSHQTIEKLNSLCDLDKEYKFLEFIVKDGQVSILGKTFKFNIGENPTDEAILSIYKDQFDKLDNESYNVSMGKEKLIFKSSDSQTTTVLSMVVKDTKYEEISSDF